MTRIIIDTIHASVRNVPTGARTVAGYTTGSSDIRWSEEDWARFPGRKIRIDQGRGTEPRTGDVKDIEQGASTIAEAVQWSLNRKHIGLRSTWYLSAADLPAARAAVHAAGLAEDVFYWVANWNLSQSEAASLLGGRIVAIQFASPTSNPHTPLPGSGRTLSEANCDLSVAVSWWLPEHQQRNHHRRRVHPKVLGSTAGGALAALLAAILHQVADLKLTPAETGALTTLAAALTGWTVPAKGKPRP